MKITKSVFQYLIFSIKYIMLPMAITYILFFVLFNITIAYGESMQPTIKSGDILVIKCFNVKPEKEDIILCSSENTNMPLIKRIIATEGDTINIDYKKGDVMINGRTIKEDYINELTHTTGDILLPLTVPKGYIFVMGDNRNNSIDSRFAQVGLIREEDVKGTLYFKLSV